MVVGFPIAAQALPAITYTGRLLNSSGNPVTASAVDFLIQVRSPSASDCLMFEEVQQKNLSQTAGEFSISINDGSATVVNTEPFAFDRIFQNRGSFTFAGGKCTGVNPYVPGATDGRVLSVSFNDGTFAGWEELPELAVNFAPMALESVSVGGFKGSELFRVLDGSNVPVSLAAWSSTDYQTLLDIIAGTANIGGNAAGFTGSLAGDVNGTQGATSVVRIQGRNVHSAAPSNGDVLTWNNAQSRWEAAAPTGGSGTVTSVSGTAPISVTATTTPVVSLDAAGVTATHLADNAVTTLKINAGAVTTAKIADANVTPAKLQLGSVDGQSFRYASGSWSIDRLRYTDLVNASAASPWPASSCTAGQAVIWTSGTDTFSCATITPSIGAGAIGTTELANGAVTAAKLDSAVADGLWTHSGGNVYRSTGSVGIGGAPGTALDVTGAITSRPYGTATGETGQLILRELAGGGTQTVTVRAPDAITTSYALTLPDTPGSLNEVLTTDGSGGLSWSAPSAVVGADSLNFTDFADSMSLDASTDIAVSGTNVLSVTNSGTGHSFRVNDEAGDTSPFVINDAGEVGIGTASPNAALDVMGGLYLRGLNAISFPTTDSTLGASIAIGAGALGQQESLAPAAYGNIAIGYSALSAPAMTTAARNNVAIGYEVLKDTTSAQGNIAIGNYSQYRTTSGNDNVSIGRDTLVFNTTGEGNMAIGFQALYNNTDGISNTAVGPFALLSNTTGRYNVSVGHTSGSTITTGEGNTILGTSVGVSVLSTGSYNILIGGNADVTTPLSSTSNFLNIGNTIYATGVNTGTLGAPAGDVGIGTSTPAYKLDVAGDLRITGTPYRTGGDITWQVPSDARLKDVSGAYEHGLEDLVKLDVIRFRYKENNPIGADSSKEYSGLLAQEAQKVIPDSVSEDSRTGFLTLNTTPIFWAMVKAMKEIYYQMIGIEDRQIEQARQLASVKATVEAKVQQLEIENLAKERKIKELEIQLKQQEAESRARFEQIEKMLKAK